MKELFEQNKLLFLAVITVLIIVFLVKKLIDYITKKGLEGIRLDVYKLFVEAEKTFRASKQGQKKFDYVIHMARGLLPKPIQLFVSDNMLKEIVQLWFDGVKDLLDDGKLNNSPFRLRTMLHQLDLYGAVSSLKNDSLFKKHCVSPPFSKPRLFYHSEP